MKDEFIKSVIDTFPGTMVHYIGENKMQGTLHTVELSRSGKSWRLNIDGTWYVYTSKVKPSEGSTVEFAFEEKEYNGRSFRQITSLKETAGEYSAPGKQASTDSAVPPDVMRAISNIVASAAQGGAVTPENVQIWITNTYNGLMNIVSDSAMEEF